MKSIFASIASFGFFIFAAASSNPHVGDTATFAVSSPDEKITRELKIIAIQPEKNLIRTSIIESFNGIGSWNPLVDYHEDLYNLDGMIALSRIKHKCKSAPYFGKHEIISTTAGRFKVCHFKSEQDGIKMDYYYTGEVPFGIVKEIYTDQDGKTTTVELQSFVKLK